MIIDLCSFAQLFALKSRPVSDASASKRADAVGEQFFKRHVYRGSLSVDYEVIASGCTAVKNAESRVVLLQ
jgi:hypothetical protein